MLTNFDRWSIIIKNLNIAKKLMTKRSTYFGRFTESCRWCDYSSQRNMEWTWEGGSKEPDLLDEQKGTRVMPNGISARYQGKAHDGACGERVCFCAPN